MNWKKLMFARTWDEDHKEGDFTGTYISEDKKIMIEPLGISEYRIRRFDIPSNTIEGELEYLMNLDEETTNKL